MFQLIFRLAGTNSVATLQADTRFWLGFPNRQALSLRPVLLALYDFSYASEILEKTARLWEQGPDQERKRGASFSGLEAERNSSAN